MENQAARELISAHAFFKWIEQMFWKSRLQQLLHHFRSPMAVANRHHADDFVQLYVDRLEDRRVLSVSVTLLAGDILEIVSDGDSDTISIQLGNAGGLGETIDIFDDPGALLPPIATFNSADLNGININLGGGTDVLNLQVPSGDLAGLPIVVNDGTGTNTGVGDTVHIFDNPDADTPTHDTTVYVLADNIEFLNDPGSFLGTVDFGAVDFELNGDLNLNTVLNLTTGGNFTMNGDIVDAFASDIFANIGGTFELGGDILIDGETSITATNTLLTTDVEISGTNVSFTGDITGATGIENLIIDVTGNTSFDDAISNLNSLDVDADLGINLQDNIEVNDTLSLDGDVLLLDDVELTSTTNLIDIVGNVNGDITLDDSLTLSAANGTTVSGTIGTDINNVLVNDGTLTAGTIDIEGSLTANEGVATTVGDIDVGMNLAATLGATSAGNINVTGTSSVGVAITSEGSQTYTGFVTLNHSGPSLIKETIFTSNTGATITFNAINGNLQNATINTTGDTILNGDISNIGDLATDAGGTTIINSAGATSSIVGTNFTFNDAVELQVSTTITAFKPFLSSTTSDPAVTFNDVVNSEIMGLHNLVVNVTNGDATFGDAVGQTSPLGSLNVTANNITLNSVETQATGAATGEQNYEATTITTAGDYDSNGGGFTVDGAWTVAENTTVETDGGQIDASLATISANMAMRTLSLDAGLGDVSLALVDDSAGAVLDQLTVIGSTIDVTDSIDVGAGGIDFTGNTDLEGSLNSAAGIIAFDGDLIVDGAQSITSNNEAIQVSGTIGGKNAAGNDTLNINAGTGNVTLQGNVGSTPQDLEGITLTGSMIAVESIDIAGGITLNGEATLNGNSYTNSSGNILFNGDTNLTATTNVNSSGTLTFNQAVQGTGVEDLLLTATAITMTGVVSQLNNLTANTSGNTTFGSSVNLNGNLATNAGGKTLLGNSVTTAGTQTYGDDVELTDNATLSASTINFNGKVDSEATENHNLTIAAPTISTTFNGVVGGEQELGNLSVNSGATFLNSGSVTTTGEQHYGGEVTLGAHTVLTAVDQDADGEGIDLTSTVIGGGFNLTISGGGRFDGVTSGINDLIADNIATSNSLNVNTITVNGLTELGGSLSATDDIDLESVLLTNTAAITTGAAIDIDGDVTGDFDLTLSAVNDTTVTGTIGGSVNNLIVSMGDLAADAVDIDATLDAEANVTTTLGASAGTIDVAGTLNSTGAISTDVGGITIGTNLIAGSTVTSAMGISVGGTSSLAGDVVAMTGDIALDGDVTLMGDVLMNANQAIQLGGNIDGNFALSLTSTTRVDVEGTAGTDINDLTIMISAGNFTAGVIDIDGALSSDSDVTTDLGGITVGTNFDVDGSVTSKLGIDVSGTSTLNGSVTAQAGSIELDQTVMMDSNLTISATDTIVLGDGIDGDFNLTLSATNGTSVTGDIGSDINNFNVTDGDLSANSIDIDGTLDADANVTTTVGVFAHTVDVAGTLDSGGVIESETGGITVGTNLIAGSTVTSAMGISVAGTSSLNGNVTANNGDVQLIEDVTLNNSLTISASNEVLIGNDIEGDVDLTFNANNGTTVIGDIGMDINNLNVTDGDLLANSIDIDNTLDADANVTTTLDLTAGTIDVENHLTVGGDLKTETGGILVGGMLSVMGSIMSAADLNITGMAELCGDVMAAGTITFDDAVVLTEDISVTSSMGDVLFNGTVNSDNVASYSLAVEALNGSAIFASTVGTGVDGILSALNVDADIITLQDDTSTEGNIVLTGTTIQVDQLVTTTTNGEVTIDNAGQLILSNTAEFDLDGAFNQVGDGHVSTGADITTTDDAITFFGPVSLTENVNLDTGTGPGTVEFNDTFDGEFILDVSAGMGEVSFLMAVGATDPLAGITINNSANTNFDGTVAVEATGLTVNSTDTVTFAQAVSSSESGMVMINNGGLLTIQNGANFDLDGNFSQVGSGLVSLGGDITTTGDSVSFAEAVTLTQDVSVNTTNTGATALGNITFSKSLDGTSGAEGITLNAGDLANINVTGKVGDTDRLESLNIVATNNASFSDSVSVGNIIQQAGAGVTTFHGPVDTNTAVGISLDGTAFSFNSTVTTTNLGTVTITNSGLLDITPGANFLLDGEFLQDGTGDVNLASNITTTDDAISFTGPLTLKDAATVELKSTGGAISFLNTVNGETDCLESLIINAGSTGNVTFDNAVGGDVGLNNILIENANAVNFAMAVTANSLTQNMGTATTTLSGLVTLKGGDLDLTTNDIAVNGGVDAGVSGNVLFNTAQNITVNSNIETVNGDVSSDSEGTTLFTAIGSISSTTGDVSMEAETLTMQDHSKIDAGSGMIDLVSNQDLTLSNVTTSNNTTNAVSLTSMSGAIVDGGNNDLDIVANSPNSLVTIRSATGMGSGDALETAIAAVDVVNSTSGNIEISEQDGLTVLNAEQQTAGNIDIQTNDGPLTIGDGTATTAVSTLGAGTISLSANGATGSVDVQSGITAEDGSIDITADAETLFGSNGDVTTTTGNIQVTADDVGGVDGITMANGALLSTEMGEITLDANGDIALGGLQTGNSTATAITVTSTLGGMTDAGNDHVDISADSGTITLSAANGIGSANAIELAASELRVTNTATGAIDIEEATDVTLLGLTNLGTGNASLSTVAGEIVIEDGEDGVSTTTGNVALTTNGTTQAITINEDITTTGGNVLLTATGDISSTLGDDITTSGIGVDSGSVTLNAAQAITLSADIDTSNAGANAGGAVNLETTTGTISLTNITTTSTGTTAGDVTVTAGDSDITLNGAITATGDTNATTTLSAVGGDVIDGNDGNSVITTGDLAINASGNIGQIDAANPKSGNAIDAVILGELTNLTTTEAGQIHLKSTQAIAASAGAITPGSGNAADLLIQTTGDLNLGPDALNLSDGDDVSLCTTGVLTVPNGGVNVGSGNLIFEAADIVDPAGREVGKLVASDLNITTTNSTADLTFSTDVDTLTIDFTASHSASSLTVNECNSVHVNQITSHSSNVTVNAALDAPGDITIDQIDAGTGIVTLDTSAMGGEIIDGDDTVTDIIASELAMTATTGIGNDNKLEVEVDNLAATTITGDINVVDETNGLTITDVNGVSGLSITTGGVGDDIEVNANGPLMIDSSVENVGAGDITLAADGTGINSDVTISASVAASGGNINTFAGDSILLADNTVVSATGNGGITLRAGVDFQNGGVLVDGNNAGDVAMGDGSQLNADSGDITVRAPRDIAISILSTNSNITVCADNPGVSGTISDGDGAITDVLSTEAANLTAMNASLCAATGIGTAANNINTALDTIDLTNSTMGDINVAETEAGGDLEVTSATNMIGDISISTEDGSLMTSGPITTTGPGEIALTAADAGGSGDDNLIINDEITTEDGSVTLTSNAGNVEFGADGDVTTMTGAVTVSAGTDDGSGEITQHADSIINTGNANVTLDANGDVTLGNLTTTSEADDAVSITTTASVNSADPFLTNINAADGRLVIEAMSGVGPLKTEIESLDVLNETGDVIIEELDALDVIRVTDNNVGPLNVDLSAGGTLTLEATESGIDATAVSLETMGADSDIVVESQITADNEITLMSDNDIALGNNSTLTTPSIDATAVGAINMQDGSIVDATGGTATFMGNEDITVSQVTADTIQVISTGGAIVDADTDMGPDLIGIDLQLFAANGIGTDNPLETQVETLEAINSTMGNIEIDNSTGNLLTLNGISNLGSNTDADDGTLVITNQGAIDVENVVQNTSGGELSLNAMNNGGDDDHLTINAPIIATGNNADISLIAGTDLVINDTGLAGDGEDDISGKSVLGTAEREVMIAPMDVIVRSSTGSVTKATPDLDNVVTPQVLSTGIAVIQGDFGDVDNNNFIFQILWDPEGPVQDTYASGDPIFNHAAGTNVGTTPGVGPGSFEFDHQYFANPNENSPSADIPITITLFDDPNITFLRNGVDLGENSVTSLADVPGEGISGGIAFDLSIEVPPLEAPRVQFGESIESAMNDVSEADEETEVQSVLDTESVRDDRMVMIQKIGPNGQVEIGADGKPIQQTLYGDEAQAVLDDLPGLFEKLEEGHWKIYLKEGGDAQQQLVRDVVLRDGRPATEDAGTQDRPPTEDTGMMRTDEMKELPPTEGLQAPVIPQSSKPAPPPLPQPIEPEVSQTDSSSAAPVVASMALATFAIPDKTAKRISRRLRSLLMAAKETLSSFL